MPDFFVTVSRESNSPVCMKLEGTGYEVNVVCHATVQEARNYLVSIGAKPEEFDIVQLNDKYVDELAIFTQRDKSLIRFMHVTPKNSDA